MYSIYKKADGTFLCKVEIQDGTESWTEKDLETAKKNVKESVKFLQGNKIKKKDIPIFEEVIPTPTYRRIN